MDVYINLQRRSECILLAMCDANMLGKTLKQGKIVFHIREEFYKGALVSLEEAVDLIQQSTIVNMIGRRIVKKAVEKGLVHPDAVLEIAGVPHAQIVKV
ncbi:DUF424 family protein [Candidatus Bathyarchaeota archaeon]|nr:DUF424 family protein [Candidatus Bathyarchaeota archaeon]